MSVVSSNSDEAIALLKALNIDTNTATKVTLVFECNQPVFVLIDRNVMAVEIQQVRKVLKDMNLVAAAQEEEIKPAPIPPPSRLLKIGELNVCPVCDSSVHRNWWGKIDGCIQPLCHNYFQGPPGPRPNPPRRRTGARLP